MKYLCLIYFDETVLDALPREEAEALWSEAEAYQRELGSSPGYIGAALQPTHAAITLRRRGGTLSTVDGPFAETKEQLGGFLLIDADDLDDALDVAARAPAARFGSVEVRPVMELERQAVPDTAVTRERQTRR